MLRFRSVTGVTDVGGSCFDAFRVAGTGGAWRARRRSPWVGTPLRGRRRPRSSRPRWRSTRMGQGRTGPCARPAVTGPWGGRARLARREAEWAGRPTPVRRRTSPHHRSAGRPERRVRSGRRAVVAAGAPLELAQELGVVVRRHRTGGAPRAGASPRARTPQVPPGPTGSRRRAHDQHDDHHRDHEHHQEDHAATPSSASTLRPRRYSVEGMRPRDRSRPRTQSNGDFSSTPSTSSSSTCCAPTAGPATPNSPARSGSPLQRSPNGWPSSRRRG